MVVNSALWAAAGDALGWITELSRGEAGVSRRTGVEFVTHPIDWSRNIGGRAGVVVEIPAGSYSDDTQLRLAVCRSIRGDGQFDAEPFAKIELPVWTSYALGAGRGTKAAASNLTKRSVNWFSNFFEAKDQRYVRSGGNGAAMRIQPHVWAARSSSETYLLECLRDLRLHTATRTDLGVPSFTPKHFTIRSGTEEFRSPTTWKYLSLGSPKFPGLFRRIPISVTFGDRLGNLRRIRP